MGTFQSNPDKWLIDLIIKPEKKVVFFVGAGISVNSGLPNFVTFSENFLKSILPDNWKKSNIDELCQKLRPEVMLQVVQQVHEDRTLEFYRSLESGFPNANHFFLAMALKAGHCVITTNVDTLIEQACEKLNVPCSPIIHDKDFKKVLKEQLKDNPRINVDSRFLKLHGSIESDKRGRKKYSSIRFILDRVGLGLTENQEQIFSACLQDYDFIFLGYSGNDHFSVLPAILKTDSDQKIYWFKYESDRTSFHFSEGRGYFGNCKKELLEKALDGKDTEGKTPMVKWEEISILEVLSKRENAILARGNSSQIIAKSLERIIRLFPDPEVRKIMEYTNNLTQKQGNRYVFYQPRWVKQITGFERHILAAKLLIRMRDLKEHTETELNHAEDCASNDAERAIVKQLRALKSSISREPGRIKASKKDLIDAISTHERAGNLILEVEARLELANHMRIDREFESAKETLDKAHSVLLKNKLYFKGLNRSSDWPRLMAHLNHYQGLVYGLGQKGTIADKLKGVHYCDEAYVFAYQAGDVSRMAAAHNARGLIIYQLAERSNSLLYEAELSLDNAIALNTRMEDPRGSFQPFRNRILIQRLRILGSRLHARDYWIRQAEKDCTRTLNYLSKIKSGDQETGADIVEVKYRQAQVFGLKGDHDAAHNLFREILVYWEKEKNLHQQARIWQDLLSLADSKDDEMGCLYRLLSLIGSIFLSKEEYGLYKNDILHLENIRDMLIDGYLVASEQQNQECLDKVLALMDLGGKIAEEFDEEKLSHDFQIWSSTRGG